jgi:hypothetical protein
MLRYSWFSVREHSAEVLLKIDPRLGLVSFRVITKGA